MPNATTSIAACVCILAACLCMRRRADRIHGPEQAERLHGIRFCLCVSAIVEYWMLHLTLLMAKMKSSRFDHRAQ